MNIKEFCEKYSIDRLGTNSLKWDALDKRYGDKDLIAMWVADMEFKTPEVVVDALKKRIQHGIFGYSYVPESYYDAFIKWEKNEHNYEINKEWMRFSTGVVLALYWFVNAFTKPNDSVMIITPVYYPFHNAVNDNGRKLITSELINTNGVYTIDFENFEKNIVENDVKLFIQCSPHNPVGRVWTEEELDKVLSICKKHNVLVVSDEIHQDIIVGKNVQIPAAIVSCGKYADNLITVTAPSKTFNLAGLLNSHIIISNEEIRAKYDAYAKTVNQTEVNIMGLTAAEAAYSHGKEWLDSLLDVIRYNYNYVKTRLNEKAPKIIITPLEGTYLAWLDLREYIDPKDTKTFIQDKCRLAVDLGELFSKDCKGFVRLNMATDPKYVEMAVDNIIKNINSL
ncbi:pyridoxal phosphate-dependent aminotransferase [Clostridium sp. CF011]|uniref:MalY/PatB family protein n=1 Tax=unclassified Clostridium TaxID=2614128 RepID=UPI001C0E83B3|nr:MULTISPECIES: MalY/PatB family protein [unclassified Clostridium]MBU3092762.1 pyridoxal phosphate-dependent aminotransferase [Clostridium sp. CF011]MBW9145778.1 pyridoxal phosphate-dependent aminotransferase [Clostridium sp. CM027]UVE42157.1 pyridoxal phosphate-dependent aminotransferase [Clostridium sp. CM027]WAG71182.1 pyridoxal phosphate-dependent aminotransferase [Clostridium sp. CF011]